MTIDELEALPDGTIIIPFSKDMMEEFAFEKFEGKWIIISGLSIAIGESVPNSIIKLKWYKEDVEVIHWPENVEQNSQVNCDCATHQLMWGGCICGGS